MVKRLPSRSNRFGVYEADQDAINEAKRDLADYENEQRINAIDDEIEKWEEYKDQWESVVDKYEEEANRLKADQLLGANWEDDINNMRLDNMNDFADEYYNICKNISDIAEMTANDILKLYGIEADLNNDLYPTSTTKTRRYYYATKNGEAPNGATIGDRILTGGGTYEIVAPYTSGANKNDVTGLWSKKVDDIKTQITDVVAGKLAYVETFEELNDRVTENISYTKTNSSVTEDNTKITSSNTAASKNNTVSNDANTKSTDYNSDVIENATGVMSDLPDDIRDATYEGAKAGLEDASIKIDYQGNPTDYVIGQDGGSGSSGGISYDSDGNAIEISEKTLLDGIEQLRKTVGENSDVYKAAMDYYNSFYGDKNSKFYGVNAQTGYGYSTGKYYDNYQDYFKSFNATSKGKIGGKEWFEWVDELGRTVAANEDYFKNSYVLNRPLGYTDRERAQSTLAKAAEIGWLDELATSYSSYYTRLLDIINTPEGGDRKAVTVAREDAQRAIQEILDSKNNPNDKLGGGYDSTGKKVVSVSVNRDGEVVDKGYSNKAVDFSDIVDTITETLSAEDIYNSEVFKRIYGATIDPNNSYYDYDPSKAGNVDQVRAYDSSYNKQYESLKISNDKAADETRTNSEILRDNNDAMSVLNDTLGEGTFTLKDGADGVVQALDKNTGALLATINTQGGYIYQGKNSSGLSYGTNSNSNTSGGTSLPASGTYKDSYSQADKDAIANAQNAWKEAYAKGDTEGMKKANDIANAIRESYGDKADSSGIIVTVTTSSGSGSSSSSSSSSSTSVTVTKDSRISSSGLRRGSTTSGGYAKGTRYAPEGWALVDDEYPNAEEIVIRNPSAIGRATYLEKGDGVIPKTQTDILMDFANNPKDYIEKLMQKTGFVQGVSNVLSKIHPISVSDLQPMSNGDTINENHFDNLQIVCPNVVDGNTLVAQLKTLSMSALQRSNRR